MLGMQQPAGPSTSLLCAGSVQALIRLREVIVAFHSSGACTAFEYSGVAAFKTSRAEVFAAEASGLAVLIIGQDGEVQRLVARGSSVVKEVCVLEGVQACKAVAAGACGFAAASITFKCARGSSHCRPVSCYQISGCSIVLA